MAAKPLKYTITGKADGETIVFVHGWPDDPSIFNAQVQRLQSRFKCVLVTLPNFDGNVTHKWGVPFEEMTKRLAATVDAVSKVPVTLIIHDWGCFYGFLLQRDFPDKVKRIVSLDIGGHVKPSLFGKVFTIFYQFFLIFCFLIGHPIGTYLARAMAYIFKAPAASRRIFAVMGYPYFYMWKKLLSGEKIGFRPQDKVPVLFLYGSKKPFNFHSPSWEKDLRSRAECDVVAIPSDHWFLTRSKTREQVSEIIEEWLKTGKKHGK